MYGRKLVIAGGGITIAATVAVGVVVAIGSASALSDSAGEALDVAPVVVAAPSPTSTPTPTRTVEPEPAPAPTPETVPAPQPKDVAAPAQPPAAAPSTPATPDAVDPMEKLASSGAWQRARDWAVANGWDEQKVAAWIESMRARYDESGYSSFKTPGTSGEESEQKSPSFWHGSEKSRSQSSPDRG